MPSGVIARQVDEPERDSDLLEQISQQVTDLGLARSGDRLILGKPLGAGVMSAALKAETLDAAGYRRAIETGTATGA